MFTCSNKRVMFVPFYNAGSNAKAIVDNAQHYSMRFDDDFVPLGKPDAPLTITNDYIQSLFILGPEHLKRLTTTASVGWAAHPGNPNIFYGFTVETTGSMEKIKAFIKSCLVNAR
jgi:hypothetical protein